jgi:TorA maturation chaperone TorD
MTAPIAARERTQLHALAYLQLAGRFASPTDWGADDGYLIRCLEEAGWHDAARLAGEADAAAIASPDAFRRAFLRIVDRSLPPPYETTYTSRGSPANLADIAGFYRAFGVEIAGEKPDHLVAELEYLALLALREAHAREAGDDEHAVLCAQARASFLRDHAGCWLDAFAGRFETRRGRVRVDDRATSTIAADAREHGVAPSVASARRRAIPGPAGRSLASALTDQPRSSTDRITARGSRCRKRRPGGSPAQSGPPAIAAPPSTPHHACHGEITRAPAWRTSRPARPRAA